jgi:nitrite reductase/ring-hydroxylating ferredoxin subunit
MSKEGPSAPAPQGSDSAQRTWTPAMALDDLWEGDMVGVEVGAAKVLLINIDGDLHAYRNVCPHQASALHEALVRYPCMVDGDGMICVDVG